MKTGEAIAFLIELERIAEEAANPGEALLRVTEVMQAKPRLNQDIHDNVPRVVSRWLRAWGRHPSTYMYQYAGGYDAFLAYKHQLRTGTAAQDVPKKLLNILRTTFTNLPLRGTDYEHQLNMSMKMEAEYD